MSDSRLACIRGKKGKSIIEFLSGFSMSRFVLVGYIPFDIYTILI